MLNRLWSNAVFRCLLAVALTAVAIAGMCWAFSLTDPLSTEADLTLFEGSGTKEDPFQVASAEDLARLRDLVNQGNALAWGYYVQTADIDLAAGGDPAAVNWEPIGTAGSNHYFQGDYDGGGHVVDNLRSVDRERAGLFDYLCGTVRNLGIASGEVRGQSAGSIAETVAGGAALVNCWNAAAVDGESGAGGICRTCTGTMESCWNVGPVTSKKGVAVGLATGESGTFHNCASVGVAPGAPTIERDPEQMAWYATVDEAKAHMKDWYVGLLDYAAEPTFGDVTAAPVFTDEGGLAFEPMDGVLGGGTTGYAQAVVGGMAASQAGLLALAILAVAAVAARAVARRGSGGSVRGGQTLVGDTPLSGNSDVRPQGTVPRGPSDAGRLAHGWVPRIAAVVVFCAVFFVAFGAACDVLKSKENEALDMEKYYAQPTGCVDVLNIGTSRIGWNTDVAAMWSEYGIPSYSLWSGIEAF